MRWMSSFLSSYGTMFLLGCLLRPWREENIPGINSERFHPESSFAEKIYYDYKWDYTIAEITNYTIT